MKQERSGYASGGCVFIVVGGCESRLLQRLKGANTEEGSGMRCDVEADVQTKCKPDGAPTQKVQDGNAIQKACSCKVSCCNSKMMLF